MCRHTASLLVLSACSAIALIPTAPASRLALCHHRPTSAAQSASLVERRREFARMCAGDASGPPLPDKMTVPGSLGGTGDHWRMARARLQRQHQQHILRRQPRKLAFATTSAMVQSLGLSTEEEWLEWLELGEGYDLGFWPHVPRSPESYYRQRGEWLGWSIWLTGWPKKQA